MIKKNVSLNKKEKSHIHSGDHSHIHISFYSTAFAFIFIAFVLFAIGLSLPGNSITGNVVGFNKYNSKDAPSTIQIKGLLDPLSFELKDDIVLRKRNPKTLEFDKYPDTGYSRKKSYEGKFYVNIEKTQSIIPNRVKINFEYNTGINRGRSNIFVSCGKNMAYEPLPGTYETNGEWKLATIIYNGDCGFIDAYPEIPGIQLGFKIIGSNQFYIKDKYLNALQYNRVN